MLGGSYVSVHDRCASEHTVFFLFFFLFVVSARFCASRLVSSSSSLALPDAVFSDCSLETLAASVSLTIITQKLASQGRANNVFSIQVCWQRLVRYLSLDWARKIREHKEEQGTQGRARKQLYGQTALSVHTKPNCMMSAALML